MGERAERPGAAALYVEVLGPLRVHVAGRAVETPSPPARALLALAVCRAGEPLGRTELSTRIPALGTTRRLRAAVDEVAALVRREGDSAGWVWRHDPDRSVARLDVPAEGSDLRVVRDLVARAREHASAPATAAAHLDRALSLWRTPVLGDVAGAAEWPELVALRRDRALLAEERCAAWLDAGETARVHGELRDAVRRDPWSEHLRALLVEALLDLGRPAEAVAEYERFRRTLHDEWGLDVGPALRALHGRLQDAGTDERHADLTLLAANGASAPEGGGLAQVAEREGGWSVPADERGRFALFAGADHEQRALRAARAVSRSGAARLAVVPAGRAPSDLCDRLAGRLTGRVVRAGALTGAARLLRDTAAPVVVDPRIAARVRSGPAETVDVEPAGTETAGIETAGSPA